MQILIKVYYTAWHVYDTWNLLKIFQHAIYITFDTDIVSRQSGHDSQNIKECIISFLKNIQSHYVCWQELAVLKMAI